MRFRIVALVLAASLLGGCSDGGWDRAISYTGFDQKPQPAPAAAQPAVASSALPAAAANETETWCRQAAQSARDDAARDGFDAASQQRRADTTYTQCVRYSGGQ